MAHRTRSFCTCCKQIVPDHLSENLKKTQDGHNIVDIDVTMLDAIQTLNQKGWPTVACCEGGVEYVDDEMQFIHPYIKFDQSLMLPLSFLEPLPSMLEIEDPATELCNLRDAMTNDDNSDYSLYAQLSMCANMSIGIYMKSSYGETDSPEDYIAHCKMAVDQFTQWAHERRDLIENPFNIEEGEL